MTRRSEGLSGSEWPPSPLVLSEALLGALERLSEALENPNAPTGVLIQRLWEAEDALVAERLDSA